MKFLRELARGYRSDAQALAHWLAWPLRWWASAEAQAKVMVMGFALLSLGFIVAGLPALAFVLPGAVLVLVSLGFTLRRTA